MKNNSKTASKTREGNGAKGFSAPPTLSPFFAQTPTGDGGVRHHGDQEFLSNRAAGESLNTSVSVGTDAPLFNNGGKAEPVSRIQKLRYFVVELHMPFLVVPAACIIVCFILCIVEVVVDHKRMKLVNVGRLSVEASQCAMDVIHACLLSRRENRTKPVDPPRSMMELDRHIKKQSPSNSVLIDAAIRELSVPDCRASVLLLSDLATKLSEEVEDPLENFNSFAFVTQQAVGFLESEGLLKPQEDVPVPAQRVFKGISANLMCFPTCTPLVGVVVEGILPGFPTVDFCPSATYSVYLENTALRNPEPGSAGRFQQLVRSVVAIWPEGNLNTIPSTHITTQLMVFLALYSFIILIAVVHIFVLVRMIRWRLHSDDVQAIIGRDFCTFCEGGRVAVDRETLRILDYYCWQIGNLEVVHAPVKEQLLQAAEGNLMSVEFLSPILHHGNAPQMPEPSLNHGSGFTGIKDVMPDFLPLQRQQRVDTLRQYREEYACLQEASQMQLCMHQAVHPILLLKPFVPKYITRPRHLKPADVINLGSSVSLHDQGINMREGLSCGAAAYLFISFRQYNCPSAIERVSHHYAERRAHRDRVLRAHHRAERQDVVTFSADDAVAKSGQMAAIVVAPGVEEEDGVVPMGGYLVEALDEGASSQIYPLSCVAAGMNYLSQAVRQAGATFGGEVIQMGSDGCLLQFRTPDDVGREQQQCFGNDAPLPPEALSFGTDENDSGHQPASTNAARGVWSWHIMSMEERAVRAAVCIREKLVANLEVFEAALIPNDLMQCPMVVASAEECLRGCVPFHVSKHYCVLARCVPLLLALEARAFEYGSSIMLTETVVNRIGNIAIVRPIFLLEGEDLNYYCLHGATTDAETGVGVAEEATSFIHVQSSSAVHLSLMSLPTDGGSTSERDAEGGTQPNRRSEGSEEVHPTLKFSSSETVFDLQLLRPLDESSPENRSYCEEEARTRSRREQWRIIWKSYEDIVRDRRQFDVLLNSHRQRQQHSVSDLLHDANFTALNPGGAQRLKRFEASSFRGESAVNSEFSSVAPAPSMPLFAAKVKNSNNAQEVSSFSAFVQRLLACYKELLSLKELYGVQRNEAYSYEQVHRDVLGMLTTLGLGDEFEEAGEELEDT